MTVVVFHNLLSKVFLHLENPFFPIISFAENQLSILKPNIKQKKINMNLIEHQGHNQEI